MAATALALTGGIALREAVSNITVPKLSKKVDAPACRLAVRVLAASIPGLDGPGLLASKRPFLAASLRDSTKVTELSDYSTQPGTGFIGTCAKECPWRFMETLTFSVQLEDVLTSGLEFQLRVSNEFTFGPLKLDLQETDVGIASANLRSYVLPACVQEKREVGDSSWASPVMIIPFSHVSGGECSSRFQLGEPVAHVAMQFRLSMDPEAILRSTNMLTRRISQKWEAQIEACLDAVKIECSSVSESCKPSSLDALPWIPKRQETLDGKAAVARAHMRAWSIEEPEGPLSSPDATPDGWVSRCGPKGRTYWHHKDLGPAPWEQAIFSNAADVSLPSPEEAPQFWTSHQCPFTGRTSWHHQALGPAPWEGGPPQAEEPPAYAESSI